MKYVIVTEDLSDCPYYANTGDKICDRGCHWEPACQVDEPHGGWPATMEFESEEEMIRYLGEEELESRMRYDAAYVTDDDGNKIDWPEA